MGREQRGRHTLDDRRLSYTCICRVNWITWAQTGSQLLFCANPPSYTTSPFLGFQFLLSHLLQVEALLSDYPAVKANLPLYVSDSNALFVDAIRHIVDTVRSM